MPKEFLTGNPTKPSFQLPIQSRTGSIGSLSLPSVFESRPVVSTSQVRKKESKIDFCAALEPLLKIIQKTKNASNKNRCAHGDCPPVVQSPRRPMCLMSSRHNGHSTDGNHFCWIKESRNKPRDDVTMTSLFITSLS